MKYYLYIRYFQIVCFLFFFFQAEDGIRDVAVTGVQTCALPICRPVPAKPGEYVIAAADRAGIYIPHFCWHPRMSSVGMCRQCLVEVDGPRGPSLVVSCMTNVADGQVVHTKSPTVKKAQEGVLEFLLANHPLD